MGSFFLFAGKLWPVPPITRTRLYFYLLFFFSCDYLNIGTDNNQTIGKYCGSRSGQSVHVNGRQAVVSFHSDVSVRYGGYRLIFSHVLGKFPKDIRSCVWWPLILSSFHLQGIFLVGKIEPRLLLFRWSISFSGSLSKKRLRIFLRCFSFSLLFPLGINLIWIRINSCYYALQKYKTRKHGSKHKKMTLSQDCPGEKAW